MCRPSTIKRIKYPGRILSFPWYSFMCFCFVFCVNAKSKSTWFSNQSILFVSSVDFRINEAYSWSRKLQRISSSAICSWTLLFCVLVPKNSLRIVLWHFYLRFGVKEFPSYCSLTLLFYVLVSKKSYSWFLGPSEYFGAARSHPRRGLVEVLLNFGRWQ